MNNETNVLNMPLKTYRDFPSLSIHGQEVKALMTAAPMTPTMDICDPSGLIGIEVEVENTHPNCIPHPFWRNIEDGSLRHGGREYVSIPMKGEQIEYALNHLFNRLKIMTPSYNFSPRCSVHIHLNARTMSLNQIKNLVLTYLVFERAIFKFIGQDRDKNIHCVPLVDSSLTKSLMRIVTNVDMPTRWMKYCAINLVPLLELGTIEFRHMHGTDDIPRLLTWINIILRLKLFAYKVSFEELQLTLLQLNTNSQYRAFAERVFETQAEYIIDDVAFQEFHAGMEEGCTTAKTIINSNSYRDSLHNISVKNKKWLGLFGNTSKPSITKRNYAVNPALTYAQLAGLGIPFGFSQESPNPGQWTTTNVTQTWDDVPPLAPFPQQPNF